MEKSVCLDSSQDFARLISHFNSDSYLLPGNEVTIGEIRTVLRNHFGEKFIQRYEVARPLVESFGTGMELLVTEKIGALTNVILFLFSFKKPKGLCTVTRSDEPKAKSDKFYTELKRIHDSLVSVKSESKDELLKFYPHFEKQYCALLENYKLIIDSMKTVSGHNDRVSELVMDAIHTLKMKPESYDKTEIRVLIKESVDLIQKVFPEIKQYQKTNDLQQYFSQELNYIVTAHGEEGPRRIKTADTTKTERRKEEDQEFKKRGL